MHIHRKQKIDKLLGHLLIGLLWLPTRLLGVCMRRDHSLNGEPEQILFIKLMGLGSLINATDAVRAIRRRYPQARLILLTDTNIAGGIRPFGLFDEICTTDTNNLGRSLLFMAGFISKTWRWKRLWVIDLEVYSKLTTILSLLTAAQNRIGFYLAAVRFRKYLNTHNVPFDQEAVLEDNYAAMASVVTGNKVSATQPEYAEDRYPAKRRYIAFNNTCSELAEVRKLPDATALQVIAGTLEHTHYDIALLGAPSDRQSNTKLIQQLPAAYAGRIVNYAGQFTGFDAYYSFLQQECACMVSIDSGPLHIARKLGLPTLSLWGPTHPDHYLKIYPREADRHLRYYLKLHCSPCVHRHEQLPCGGNNVCMQHMEAAAITALLHQLLQNIEKTASCHTH